MDDGGVVDDGGLVDHGYTSRLAHISSAVQTTSPSTVATPVNSNAAALLQKLYVQHQLIARADRALEAGRCRWRRNSRARWGRLAHHGKGQDTGRLGHGLQDQHAGNTGLAGKWPWKIGSLNETFLMARRVLRSSLIS